MAFPKKTIRRIMKLGISIISLAITLTLIIGGISIVSVLSNPNNISADWEQIDANFGPLGNRFALNMTFNNEGFYRLENFTVSMAITFENKTSHENFTILDDKVFEQTLQRQTNYNIPLEATVSDFNPIPLLADNNNSWYDPDVQAYIDNGTVSEDNVSALAYPYLLWNYDLHLEMNIESTYFVRLVNFGIDLNILYTYNDAGFALAYPAYKATILGAL